MIAESSGQSRGQSIAMAVMVRLAKEYKQFNDLVEAQKIQAANMLASDIGIEIDQVVKHGGELAIVSEIYLDPRSVHGVSVRVVSYSDDEKCAVVLAEQLTKS